MKLVPFAFTAVSALVASGAWSAPIVSLSNNANALATSLLGSGVTLVPGSAVLTQASSGGLQAGSFQNGDSSIGFASGVVLSTGDVRSIPGANTSSPETVASGLETQGEISTDFSNGGGATGASFDRVTLQFNFQFGNGSLGGDVGLKYVFASEEYINFVGSTFNDVFSFELDGVNIALVPGAVSPVAINSVSPLSNSAYYINNVPNTNGLPVAGRDFQFDGLTTILTASKTGLGAGVHTMKFTITDVSDGLLDSGVFLQAGTFSPATVVPEPSIASLFAAALLGAFVLRPLLPRRNAA